MRLRRVTPLKKTALVLAICALTLLILLPAVSPVNTSNSGTPLTDRVPYTRSNTTLMVDGWPLPPPIPPQQTETLVADGWPLPPPIPPRQAETLVADGWPLPPPIPPRQAETLVADGCPLPPPIPPNMNTVAYPYSV